MDSESISRDLLNIVEMCKSLDSQRGRPSESVPKALDKMCEMYRFAGDRMPDICNLNSTEVGVALSSIKGYSMTIDNWKIEGYSFGIKDQCAILSYLLDKEKDNFRKISGNFKSSQQISRILWEWKNLSV